MNIIKAIEEELSIVPKMRPNPGVKLGGIIESLYGLCYERFMRMRLEISVPVIKAEEFPAIGEKAVAPVPAPEVGPEIVGDEFMANFEHLNKPGTTIGRVIISPNKNKTKFNDVLSLYGSGLIIDYDSWELLAVPPRAFVSEIGKNTLRALISKKVPTIYALEDGSNINLYFYGGKWNLGSTNGYDVSGLKWLSTKTFGELLAEAVVAQGGYSGPDAFFASLDQNLSYSVNFTHPAIHPYASNVARVTLVQIYNRAKKEFSSPAEVAAAADALKLAIQPEIVVPDISVAHELLINARAKKPAQNGPTFGYIIRFGPESDFPDVVFESRIYMQIRHHIYNALHGIDIKDTTPAEKCHYIALRAVLRGPKNLQEFQKMFPSMAARAKNVSILHDQVRTKIIHAFRSKDANGFLNKDLAEIEKNGGLTTKTGQMKNSVQINKIARWFIDGPLKRVGHIDGSINSAKIISDMITDDRHIKGWYGTNL